MPHAKNQLLLAQEAVGALQLKVTRHEDPKPEEQKLAPVIIPVNKGALTELSKVSVTSTSRAGSIQMADDHLDLQK